MTVVLTAWSSLAPSLTVNAARTAPFFLTVEKTPADLICVTFVEPPDGVTIGPDQRRAAYLVAAGIDTTGPLPNPGSAATEGHEREGNRVWKTAGSRWRTRTQGSRTMRLQEEEPMPQLTRITCDSRVMGGKPCIRGMRVTVGTVVGLVAAGRTSEEILREYPYLEAEDIPEALSYAAWRAEEVEVGLGSGEAAATQADTDPQPRLKRDSS